MEVHTTKTDNRKFFLVCIVTLLIFSLDILTPQGINESTLYLIPILVTIGISGKRFTTIISITAILLTFAGFYLSPPGLANNVAIISRFYVTVGICVVWYILLKYKEKDKIIKQQNAELIKNELFNRTILESSPDCLKILDIEGRIQFMNLNGLCQMEIDDFSTFKNKNWRTLWGSENEALVKASTHKALKGETARFTVLCPTAKGTLKWWDVLVSPVCKPGEPVQQIISVSRDITEQKIKELENELLAQISVNFNAENDYISVTKELCKSISKAGKFDWVELWTLNLEKSQIQLLSHYVAADEDEKFYDYSPDVNALQVAEGLAGKVWSEGVEFLWNDIENQTDFVRRDAAKKIGLKAVLGIPLMFNDEVIGVLKIGTKHDASHLKKYTQIFKSLEGFIGSGLNRKKLENDLSHLFNTIPDILCLADFKGRFLKINKAGYELLGYSEEEILYHTFDEFVHPEDKDIFTNELLRLGHGENIFKFENRYLSKGGDIIWLSWYCNSAFEEGLIYATAKNITEEKKLRELNREARSLAKIGSWEVDLVNQKTFWSDEVHQLHETDPKSFVPNLETGINFFREDFRQTVQLNIEKCISTGEPFDFQAVLVTTKKKELWVRALGNTEFADGKCKRIYGSFQDIHERKVAALELEKSLKELEDYKFSIDQSAIIAFTDQKGVITSVNDNFCKISKYTREELVGKTHQLINSKHHPKEFFKDLWETIKSGKVWRGEIKNITKDGAYYWVYTTIVPFLDEKNKPFQFLAIRFDITSRKEADTQLLQANERFEKVTEATNDAIWDWDLVNKTFYRSQAFERFFGKEATGTFPESDLWARERFHPEDFAKIQKSISEAIADPLATRGELEYRLLNINGKIVYVINRAVVIRNSEGKAIRMVGAMTDISGQKSMTVQLSELNESLQQYTSELERSNEELEQFAFVASHDLQEPLRMISSFMDLLQRKYGDLLDEKGHQYIHFATDGAKRMKQIILDLLEYSRTNKPTEGREEVDMNEVISDFKQLRRKLISEKNAIITSIALPTLNTSKAPITQILHCLLDNALKYSEEGTPPIVELNAVENEKEWQFSIKDNGIGIDPQFYDKIFVIFQRLHNKDQYAGTGIGLSIAKRHVEFLGGRIWLESAPGEGSIFYFTIPKIK